MAKWRVSYTIKYEVEAKDEFEAEDVFWSKYEEAQEHDKFLDAESLTVEAILSETQK